MTRFVVEPAGTGDRTRVTIETRTPRRPHGIGVLERWLLQRLLQGVYRRELELLGEVAASSGRGRSTGDTSPTGE